jgi:hypothetical protein
VPRNTTRVSTSLGRWLCHAPSRAAPQDEAIAQALGLARPTLSESESKQLLAAWGVKSARGHRAMSAEAAAETAEQLGFPVALKVDSPEATALCNTKPLRQGARGGGKLSASTFLPFFRVSFRIQSYTSLMPITLWPSRGSGSKAVLVSG